MRHASLFSGIGGFDLAAEWMGWENIFHCEIDEFCSKVLKYHFPNSKHYGDITKTNFTEYKGKIDVLSGGFPCQDISVSGIGVGIYGSKSGLWQQFNRVIKETNPRYVIIENSPQIFRKGFEKVLYDLSESGYDAEWQCICASDYGYPHERERAFIVAYPIAQRWTGILHSIKRSLFEKAEKANTLDTQGNPFLQFEQRYCEPAVFRVDDGVPKRLDAINRLGAYGNAIVPQIAYEIFKAVEIIERQND